MTPSILVRGVGTLPVDVAQEISVLIAFHDRPHTPRVRNMIAAEIAVRIGCSADANALNKARTVRKAVRARARHPERNSDGEADLPNDRGSG